MDWVQVKAPLLGKFVNKYKSIKCIRTYTIFELRKQYEGRKSGRIFIYYKAGKLSDLSTIRNMTFDIKKQFPSFISTKSKVVNFFFRPEKRIKKVRLP